jgi:enhancing lycopene biosynthesis protein 2
MAAETGMRIGVLLGGCGLYDGSDAQESVLVLLALEAHGERPVLLAPDIPQGRTVDHLTASSVEGEARNVLRESARLARGTIRPLGEVPSEDLEGLIIPGGYGPVVNFSTGFAQPGVGRGIVPEVASFLRPFLMVRKPIGLVGLGEVPIRTLLGQDVDSSSLAHAPGDLTIDRERRIVHTPGFAAFSRIGDVRTGIEAMVREVIRMMEARLGEESGSASGSKEPS